MRSDVFKHVMKYDTEFKNKEFNKNGGISEFDQHFIDALILDFKKGGLALPENEKIELQNLLAKDIACCAAYKNNLGEDETKLVFKR